MLRLPKKAVNWTYLIETDNIDRTKKSIINYAIDIGFNKDQLLSGNSFDFKYIESENIIKVDNIRDELLDNIYLSPRFEQKKIYLIYDASLMNQSAQNALLKTLEELPENVIIFLVATNIKRILDTIKSRCIVYYDRDEIIDISQYERLKYFDDFIRAICDIKFGSSVDYIDLLTNILNEKDQDNSLLSYLDLLNIILHDVLVYKKTLLKELMYLSSKKDLLITLANQHSIEFLWSFISDLNKIKLLPNNNLDYKMIMIDLYLKEKQKLVTVRS